MDGTIYCNKRILSNGRNSFYCECPLCNGYKLYITQTSFMFEKKITVKCDTCDYEQEYDHLNIIYKGAVS